MFKKLFVFILFSLSLAGFAKADLNVKARTAILQDFYSGEIIYEKSAVECVFLEAQIPF